METKEMFLIVNFRGGTYLQLKCTADWAQHTMQAYRQWLRAKYAQSKEEAVEIGPAFFSMFMKYGTEGKTNEEIVAEDPTYKHIDCIFELADVTAMRLENLPKEDMDKENMLKEHHEFMKTMTEYLKNELKPDAWKNPPCDHEGEE